jgi:hypothetical protein
MTEDKKWGIRQIGLRQWSVQKRTDPTDPWDWEIIGYTETAALAIAAIYKRLPYERAS